MAKGNPLRSPMKGTGYTGKCPPIAPNTTIPGSKGKQGPLQTVNYPTPKK